MFGFKGQLGTRSLPLPPESYESRGSASHPGGRPPPLPPPFSLLHQRPPRLNSVFSQGRTDAHRLCSHRLPRAEKLKRQSSAHTVVQVTQQKPPRGSDRRSPGAGGMTLWCPWASVLKRLDRFNQSILQEISPEYSLEGLKLKLKLQYFGHLI